MATRLAYEGTAYAEEYCAYRARIIDHVSQSLGPLASTAP